MRSSSPSRHNRRRKLGDAGRTSTLLACIRSRMDYGIPSPCGTSAPPFASGRRAYPCRPVIEQQEWQGPHSDTALPIELREKPLDALQCALGLPDDPDVKMTMPPSSMPQHLQQCRSHACFEPAHWVTAWRELAQPLCELPDSALRHPDGTEPALPRP